MQIESLYLVQIIKNMYIAEELIKMDAEEKCFWKVLHMCFTYLVEANIMKYVSGILH